MIISKRKFPIRYIFQRIPLIYLNAWHFTHIAFLQKLSHNKKICD